MFYTSSNSMRADLATKMEIKDGIIRLKGEEFKIENFESERMEKQPIKICKPLIVEVEPERKYQAKNSNKSWIYIGLGLFLLLLIISLFWFNISVSKEKLKGNITVNTNIAPAQVNINNSITPINYNNYTIINNNNLSVSPIIINSVNITELMNQLRPYLTNYSANNTNSS